MPRLTLVVFEALAIHEPALARWKMVGPLGDKGSVGPLGLRRQTPFQHNAPNGAWEEDDTIWAFFVYFVGNY